MREALTALIGVFDHAGIGIHREIEALLRDVFVRSSHSDHRFIVVYWANRLFPFAHVPSRHIGVLGCHPASVHPAALAPRSTARFGCCTSQISWRSPTPTAT